MEKLYKEDTVALRADPNITGLVISTWHDDHTMVRVDGWITHTDVSMAVIDECIEHGLPPHDHYLVEFNVPFNGNALIHRNAITLVDRTIELGQLVKKTLSDAQSGTVIKVDSRCKLQPIYGNGPWNKFGQWPHKENENEFWASGDDVKIWEIRPEHYVTLHGYVGQVIRVREEVTVILQDGGVVRVRDPDELTIACWIGDYRRVNRRHLEGNSLVDNLHKVRAMLATTREREAMAIPNMFHPGLEVQTKKSNLRLGNWVIGSYNASTPPVGIVVETRPIELEVDWITANIFDPGTSRIEPDRFLTTDELDQVRFIDTHLPSSPFGSKVELPLVAGEIVRLRDEPGAAVKYAKDDGNGWFRRVPRTLTSGFNMNAFRILENRTEVTVRWQDGSESKMDSTILTHYQNIDDDDSWPGEAVSVKNEEVIADGQTCPGKLGIVQSVDAVDRVATVRWYYNPKVACFNEEPGTLVPGGSSGELSTETSTASLYDVSNFVAMSKQRGDLVALSPDLIPPVRPTHGLTADIQGAEELPWVGEVVDCGLDGYLTVRQAALNTPRDVRVRADKVIILVGVDEHSQFSETQSDDSMADWTSEPLEPILEEVEYEGGTRLDDGDEEAWQTDESAEEFTDAPETLGPGNDVDMTGMTQSEQERDPAPSEPAMAVSVAVSPPADQTEYQFNNFPSMPPQFLVLDTPAPADHHFFPPENIVSGPGFLRRIRKEHRLLQSSLPRGIWVRTWEDRLDLLRVLIIGPRGTPYALAPFVFDFTFGKNYPKEPPQAFFHSWTDSMGRINPNLYVDGKVCLSVLNTWPGSQKTESWSTEHSNMLQVLVSLLGLVLVERPYYNEAGFEDLVGTEENIINERVYSERALVMAKGFVIRAIRHPVPCLDDVVQWVYKAPDGPKLLRWVVQEAKQLRDQDQSTVSKDEKLSRGILMVLERHIPVLEELLESD